MSRRPSDMFRQNCDLSQSCDQACNYIVFGAEIAGLSFARRLERNGVNRPITVLSQGANRTNNSRISSLSFPVFNAPNAKENLIPITVHYTNSNDDSDIDDSAVVDVPFDLTRSRTDTFFAPSGVIAGTLGSYMINRVGYWDYEVSGAAAARIVQFIKRFSTATDFNPPNREWINRISKVFNIPIVGHAVGRGPGVLGHMISFIKPVGFLGSNTAFVDGDFPAYSLYTGSNNNSNNAFIREIGLDLYRSTLDRGIDVQPNLRNIHFERTDSPGIFNVTANGITYPRSKIAFKVNPLLKLQIASIGNLGIVADDIRSDYRFVASIPINGTVFPGSDRNCWLSSAASSDCGCGCGGSSKSSRSSCSDPIYDWSRRCQCTGGTGGTGATGFRSGIDFSQVTPDPDLVYAYAGFSIGNPLGCNTTFSNNGSVSRLQWNIQTYLTSDDLYTTSLEGRFSQPGHLLLVVDGQHLSNRRRISYDTDGNQVNIRFNNNIVERKSALEFATIVSNILYTLTAVKYDPRALLKVNNVCTDGTCSASPTINITPERQSTLSFWTETISLLYNNSALTT